MRFCRPVIKNGSKKCSEDPLSTITGMEDSLRGLSVHCRGVDLTMKDIPKAPKRSKGTCSS